MLTVLIFAATLSSCKKNYTCTCTKAYSGTSMYTSDVTYTYKDTKKNAEDKCQQNKTSGSDTYGNYEVTCNIGGY